MIVRNGNGFQVTGKLSGRTADRRPRGVRLSAKPFRLAAHARRTVNLSLPKVLRGQLRRKNKLTLGLTAKVNDPAGHTRTVRKRVSPRLRRS